jgi:hypothetical protein
MILVVLHGLTGHGPPGHAILFTHPLVQVDEFAPFGAKGSKWIILPLDLLVAGRTFHLETNARENLVGFSWPAGLR